MTTIEQPEFFATELFTKKELYRNHTCDLADSSKVLAECRRVVKEELDGRGLIYRQLRSGDYTSGGIWNSDGPMNWKKGNHYSFFVFQIWNS